MDAAVMLDMILERKESAAIVARSRMSPPYEGTGKE
jgi:hypothetical protein